MSGEVVRGACLIDHCSPITTHLFEMRTGSGCSVPRPAARADVPAACRSGHPLGRNLLIAILSEEDGVRRCGPELNAAGSFGPPRRCTSRSGAAHGGSEETGLVRAMQRNRRAADSLLVLCSLEQKRLHRPWGVEPRDAIPTSGVSAGFEPATGEI